MQIHVARAGKELGVFSQEEVRSRLASGEFLMTDHGWAAGQGDWKLLSAFPELAPPPKPLPPPPAPIRELPPRPDPTANVRKPKKKSGESAELGLAPAATPPAEVKTALAPAEVRKPVSSSAPRDVVASSPAPTQPTIVTLTSAAAAPEANEIAAKAKPEPETLSSPKPEPESEPSRNAIPEPEPIAAVAYEPETQSEPEIETPRHFSPEPVAGPESSEVIRVTLEPRRPEPKPAPEPRAPLPEFHPTVPGEATASLVLGLLSVSLLPVVAALPAVCLGHIAKRRIENSRGTLRGAGMALTGLVTGYIGGAIGLVALLAAIALSLIGFAETRKTQETAISNGRTIAEACRLYASTHEGKFPEKLESLVPDYIPDPYVFLCPFTGTDEPIGYHYYGATHAGGSETVLLVSKGHTTRKRHVVVYIDGSIALQKLSPTAAAPETAP